MAAGGAGVSGGSGADKYGLSEGLKSDLRGYLKARTDSEVRTDKAAEILRGIEERHNVPLEDIFMRLSKSGSLDVAEKEAIARIAREVFFAKLAVPDELIGLLYAYAGAVLSNNPEEVSSIAARVKDKFGFSPDAVTSSVRTSDLDAYVEELARGYIPESSRYAKDTLPRGGSPISMRAEGLPLAVRTEFQACIAAYQAENEEEGDRLSALIKEKYKFDTNDVIPTRLKESNEYYVGLLASEYAKVSAKRT